MRDYYEIKLKALKDRPSRSAYNKGETCIFRNNIFDRNNGIAFFEIGLDWEIIYTRRFTGVFDMEAKEIFDKDILKDNHKNLWVIEEVPGGFYISRIDEEDNWSLSELSNYSKFKEFEVIGNVYENPDLLK